MFQINFDPYIDREFITEIGPRLEGFSWKNNKLANCRCPICKDSKKNKSKKRFYFYLPPSAQHFNVKCQNCGYSKSFSNFLKENFEHVYSVYKLKQFGKKSNPFVEEIKPDRLNVDIQHLLDARLMEPITPGTVADDYLNSRRVPEPSKAFLYWTKDFYTLSRKIAPTCSQEVKGNRLIFPLLNEEGEFQGIQSRALDEDSMRYLILKVSESSEKFFGLERLNKNEVIFVFEGPMEPLYFDNSMSICGGYSAILEKRLPKDKTIFVLDNEPRNLYTCRYMEKAAKAGFAVCVFPDKFEEKDMGEAIMNGKDPVKLRRIIMENAVKGLEFGLKFNKWKKL